MPRGASASRPLIARLLASVPPEVKMISSAPGGAALPMELRGVAYDAELVAEVFRRVGDGVIDLQLA